MPVTVFMPALSPTMDKGKLVRWLKKPGDAIVPGNVLAEIETDKAVMEVESIEEGILSEILVPDDTPDVAVNQPIAIILLEGESPSSSPSLPSASPAAFPLPGVAPPTPLTSPLAEPSQKPLPSSVGSSAEAEEAERILSSPLARRIAQEKKIVLSQIKGSGPKGRIIERDVLNHLANQLASPQNSSSRAPLSVSLPSPVSMGAQDSKQLFTPGTFTEIPHDNLRRTIAQRLMEAKSTIPHFYLRVECVLDSLLKLRQDLNATADVQDGKPLFRLSVNDFIIKAFALALMRVPKANVTWTEQALLQHESADIGVAVAIPGGLLTPIVRQAHIKSVKLICTEMRDFIARAQNKRLKPEEYLGGTSAISNLGMFGIDDFYAIINPPHASILAVGAAQQKVIVAQGQQVIATCMSANLSLDHRAIDGALGAQLLQAFKHFLENPLELLL